AIVERVTENAATKSAVHSHAWYDEKYVGWAGDKIATWRGYSANLRPFGNYRTIYINYVVNYFSPEENTRLFGQHFAHVIRDLETYICLYVTACPRKGIPQVIEQGFTYKQFERNIHPSFVLAVADFAEYAVANSADQGIKLLRLQQ